MDEKKILIVAGEPSGDLHASNLVNNLKELDPGLRFFGLGGNLSRDAGVDTIFDISKLAFIGLVDVLKNIFTVGKVFKAILDRVDREKPDLAILVDYPGFNLRLAAQLKKRGIPVVYYISPQVWAWGRDRVNIIKRCVDKIIVFFKFEEELYRTYGINAEFVGHPLIDTVNPSRGKDATLDKYGLSINKTTIALLPGSRKSEIRTLLPVMARACRLINDKIENTQFVIAKYDALPGSLFQEAIKDCGIDIKIVSGDTYNVAAAADFAIVASGTATLETAMLGTPLVIIYTTTVLNYILYRFVATIDFIGLVNIIAGRQVAPELLQYNATPDKISQSVVEILSDEKRLKSMKEELRVVKSSLGTGGAGRRAAEAVVKLLR